MNDIFFTSDLHFFHDNIVGCCNRPWTKDQQTDELIERWNNRVGMYDTVYSLGDFAFGGKSKTLIIADLIRSLNGNIHFITGNHCNNQVWEDIADMNIPNVLSVSTYREATFSIGGVRQKFIMCHYPFAVWNGMQWGSIHLHGHSHGSYKPEGKMMDVGIDTHPEHTLYSLHEVMERVKDVPIVFKDHHNEGTK